MYDREFDRLSKAETNQESDWMQKTVLIHEVQVHWGEGGHNEPVRRVHLLLVGSVRADHGPQ